MSVPDRNREESRQRIILVVDDSAYIRRMIRFALNEQGYRVIEANDGIDAIKYVDANPVDLIITDLKMPNMDGYDLIRQVRSRPEYQLLPIIMLTAETNDNTRNWAKLAGVSAFIVKPFVPEQISGLIRGVFE